MQPFRPIGRFSHRLLQQAVQEDCGSCHSGPGDALHRKIKGNCGNCHTDNIYDAYTCYGCHEHSRSKIREEHLEEGIHDSENCVDCHRSGDDDEAKYLWRSRRLQGGRVEDFLRGTSDEGRRREDHD